MAAFYLAAVFCGTGITLYRARTIAALPDSKYTFIPIVSTLLRLIGESALTGFSLLGAGVCLYIWFSNLDPVQRFASRRAASAASASVRQVRLPALFRTRAYPKPDRSAERRYVTGAVAAEHPEAVVQGRR